MRSKVAITLTEKDFKGVLLFLERTKTESSSGSDKAEVLLDFIHRADVSEIKETTLSKKNDSGKNVYSDMDVRALVWDWQDWTEDNWKAISNAVTWLFYRVDVADYEYIRLDEREERYAQTDKSSPFVIGDKRAISYGPVIRVAQNDIMVGG